MDDVLRGYLHLKHCLTMSINYVSLTLVMANSFDPTFPEKAKDANVLS